MKKILFIVALLAIAFVQRSYAQETPQQTLFSQLLSHYYNIKDALVAGNATVASMQAEDFVKTVNGIDHKLISEGNIHTLLKDAGAISETKDIRQQRSYFSNLSDNMYLVAKAVKLTADPVYYNYCPMKKSYWLSNNKAIKNPYYGSRMLTCGKITETIK